MSRVKSSSDPSWMCSFVSPSQPMLFPSILMRPGNSGPELAEGTAAMSQYAFESQLSRMKIRPPILPSRSSASPVRLCP